MSNLLTVSEARALVPTSLSDDQLERIIAREEMALIERYGAHYVDGSTTVQETVSGDGKNVFLRRRAGSIAEITVDGTALTADDYLLWGGQGRIERLPAGTVWTSTVVVTYVPANDNSKRIAALIDLLRLTLERTSMKSESVAGEYSYQAPDWDAERRRIYRRVGFIGV